MPLSPFHPLALPLCRNPTRKSYVWKLLGLWFFCWKFLVHWLHCEKSPASKWLQLAIWNGMLHNDLLLWSKFVIQIIRVHTKHFHLEKNVWSRWLPKANLHQNLGVPLLPVQQLGPTSEGFEPWSWHDFNGFKAARFASHPLLGVVAKHSPCFHHPTFPSMRQGTTQRCPGNPPNSRTCTTSPLRPVQHVVLLFEKNNGFLVEFKKKTRMVQ